MKMLKYGILAAPFALVASMAMAGNMDHSTIETDEWSKASVMNDDGVMLGHYGGQVMSEDGMIHYFIVESVSDESVLYAIPSEYMQANVDKRILIIDMDEAKLVGAPVYSTDTDVNDPVWKDGARAYYEGNAQNYGGFGSVD